MRGINELMKGPEMLAILNDGAARIAAAAGDGYDVETARPLTFAGIASVRAVTYDAYYDALENETLDKAAESVKL